MGCSRAGELFRPGLFCPDRQDKLIQVFSAPDFSINRRFFRLLHEQPSDNFILLRRGTARKAANSSWYGRCSVSDGSIQSVNNLLLQTAGPLTRELLEYWVHHPERLGTLEAIVEWWLLEHRIQQVADELRSVLSDLVGSGFVVPRHEADGRTYYRLNREREAEILSWLQARPCGLDRVTQTSIAKEQNGTRR